MDNDKRKILDTALGGEAKEFRKSAKGAGKAAGEATAILAKSVKTLVSPLKLIIWGWEQIEKQFIPEIEKKLANVPEDRRVTPMLPVAGPTFEAIRFTGDEPVLRDLFANLLATAMDAETASSAHPAFVEIIKQLLPDEARILRYLSAAPLDSFPMIELHRIDQDNENKGEYQLAGTNITILGKQAKCEHRHLVQSYIDNLIRLQIIASPTGVQIADDKKYEALEQDDDVKDAIKKLEASGGQVNVKRKLLNLTLFGKQFLKACVIGKDEVS